MHPRTYTLDKLWEIQKGVAGTRLRGIALGVAQYVVGLFDLQYNRRPGAMKMVLENEPFWLNMEAFKAARVFIKEVSDIEVTHWGHAFVYRRTLGASIGIGGASVFCEIWRFNNLPFHSRGFVRMVPKEHWASILILAALIEPDIQMACDEHGFVWARTLVNDCKRPHPSFPEMDYVSPSTEEKYKVKGDGEIDIEGAITAHPSAYVVCTMHEIHEAFDTLVERQSGMSTDTFICFASRYPLILL